MQKTLGRLDESQLGSTQKDNLLIARKSNLPGFDCPCGWPLRVGVGGNCIASAMRGTVTCPRCSLQQIDTTQTAEQRAAAAAAITGKSTRIPVQREANVTRVKFPNHRLFNRCPCSHCERLINNVTIVRGEEKGIRCGCGATCSNLAIVDLGLEVTDPKMLHDYFGPSAAVDAKQPEKQPEQKFAGFGNKGRV